MKPYNVHLHKLRIPVVNIHVMKIILIFQLVALLMMEPMLPARTFLNIQKLSSMLESTLLMILVVKYRLNLEYLTMNTTVQMVKLRFAIRIMDLIAMKSSALVI